jgi:hypothetical protein
MIPEPRDGESDDDYRRRVRRANLIRIFAPIGATIVFLGGIWVYVLLTSTPPAAVGERCNPETECTTGALCSLDDVGAAGTCVKTCEPRKASDCPAGTTCEIFDLTRDGAATGARMFACQPKR